MILYSILQATVEFIYDLTWNLYLVFRGPPEICSGDHLEGIPYSKLVNTRHLESNTFK